MTKQANCLRDSKGKLDRYKKNIAKKHPGAKKQAVHTTATTIVMNECSGKSKHAAFEALKKKHSSKPWFVKGLKESDL